MNNDLKFNEQQAHQELCNYLHNELWLPKNTDYGNSFHDLYNDLGIISAVTQIVHKCNRIKTVAKMKANGKNPNVNESLRDTLLDMANYCVMTVMELDREENKQNESSEAKQFSY